MEIIAHFSGGSADQHTLPAYEGAQSIEGFARAITLITYYFETGTVRKRFPFQSKIRVLLELPRSGSFDSIYNIITDPSSPLVTTAVGTLTVSIFGGLIVEVIKTVMNRLVGKEPKEHSDAMLSILEKKSEDIEAVGEAVEPALKKAHTAINYGAGQIVLISGSNNIVNLNPTTKHYMFTSNRDEFIKMLLVSVGMLNVNTRNGRVFNYELQRTVPIHVPRDANPRTLPNLARSLQYYSSRALHQANSRVMIHFTTEQSIDGVDKKYFVVDAYFVE